MMKTWVKRLKMIQMKPQTNMFLYEDNRTKHFVLHKHWGLATAERQPSTHYQTVIFWWVVTSFIQDIFSEQILLVDVHCHYFHGFLINKMLLSDDWSLFYLETKYCNMSEDAERLINLYFIKSHLYLTFIRTEYIFNIKCYCICDV